MFLVHRCRRKPGSCNGGNALIYQGMLCQSLHQHESHQLSVACIAQKVY